MSDDSSQLPEGMTIPPKFARKASTRRRFIEGAREGAAGRSFAHADEKAFIQRYGQREFSAYASGYNEGRAARNIASIDRRNDREH
jgi:hypothetical protein